MTNLWVIDEWTTGSAGDLINRLASHAHLGVYIEHIRPADWRRLNPGSGDIVVAFAAVAPVNASSALLPSAAPPWLRDCTVIPVVEKAADAPLLPGYLYRLNAFVRDRYHPNYWADVLADDALTRALLPRERRTAFISYKRTDSLALAQQLADRLSQDGFEPFLDERTIGRGAAFEREIAYHLDDADMIIVLATQNLQHSVWVQREISFANRSNIALTVVDCGAQRGTLSVVSSALPSQRFRPSGSIPRSPQNQLDPSDLDDLIGKLYRSRISGIARRIHNLVPAAQALLPAGASRALGELLDMNEVVQVLPFRPTAEVAWRLRRKHAGASALRIVYPENVPRDPRVRALRWSLLPHQPKLEIVDVRRLF